MQIIDNFTLNGENFNSDIKCQSCNKLNHCILECPLLHFNANKNYL
jgi:hypothetical protein